jgi:hypothetical protein
LGIDLFKSVLMYSNGAICLIKLLFKMGLFTVCSEEKANADESCVKVVGKDEVDVENGDDGLGEGGTGGQVVVDGHGQKVG